MSEQVVDLNEVMERVQDDKELLLELFEIFDKDYGQKIQTLKVAVGAKDIEVIKDVIHSTTGIEANTERVLDKMNQWGCEDLFYESNGVGLAAVLLIKNRYYFAVSFLR